MRTYVRPLVVLLLFAASLFAQSPIGTAFLVGDVTGGADTAPAVACEGTTGRHLVVWNASPAGTTAEVRGQLVSATGALLGNQILFATDEVLGARPVVAAVRARGRFVVGWIVDLGGVLRPRFVAVDASTGAVSGTTTLTGQVGSGVTQMALGGDSRVGVLGVGDNVLVAARLQSQLSETVQTYALQVGATGAPVLITGSGQTLASGDTYYHVALSEHGGTAGRWLVSFSRYDLFNGHITSNFVLNDNALPCVPTGVVFPITTNHVSVATRDGNDFAAVVAGNGVLKVYPITFTGACGAGTLSLGAPATIASSPTSAVSDPEITFARDKYLVTWRSNTTLTSPGIVHVLGLDPTTCSTCSNTENVELTVVSQEQPVIAAQWSGSATANDEALVVWSNGTIRARRHEARGTGTVTSLGGSCGIQGLSDLNTYGGRPVLGDTTFRVEMASPTAPVLALVLGFAAAPIPCGPCTLVPSLDLLLPGVSPTPIPIPCAANLVGTELFTQWLQLRTAGCPLLPDIGLSNTLRFTIGQ